MHTFSMKVLCSGPLEWAQLNFSSQKHTFIHVFELIDSNVSRGSSETYSNNSETIRDETDWFYGPQDSSHSGSDIASLVKK